ncbi:MAG: hypothetical protein OEZ39_02725 [Gammaproteobacteria bacterium]|nr:hypothetical protein [Gammaproteobacteria bacterium]MDH5650770.1 hypothetical protein [Gammaproteobacteria bacterium]
MKKVITTLALSLLSVAGATADEALSKYGKVYENRQAQLTVELVPYQEKNKAGLQDVLIRISGPDAEADGIDGKIIRYRPVHAGTGVNFQYHDTKDNKWYNRMGSRAGWWGADFYEVWLGNKTIKVWLNGNASSLLNTKHFLTAYNKQK